nr:hypothetical transcript [Hymenolepis microstoma]
MAHLKRHHILRLIPTLILILTQLTSHLSSATGCIPTPHTHHYNQLLHNHAHISTPTTPPPPPPHSSLPPPNQPTRFLSLRRKHIYPLPLSTLAKPSNVLNDTNDTTVVTNSPRISTVPHRLLGAHRLPPHLKPKSYPSSIFTSSFSSTTYYNTTTIISNPPSTSHHSNYMLTTTNSTTLHMHALSSSFDH